MTTYLATFTGSVVVTAPRPVANDADLTAIRSQVVERVGQPVTVIHLAPLDGQRQHATEPGS